MANNSTSTRAAGVLPLHYYQNVPEEHAIIYFSTKWNSLADILEVPAEQFRSQQCDWRRDQYNTVNWQLFRPVTAHLQCGYASQTATAKMTNALDSGGLISVSERSMVTSKLRAEGSLFGSWVDTIMALVPNGCYYAEFAKDTRTLLIEYFPSVNAIKTLWKGLYPKNYNAGEPDPIPRRYDGQDLSEGTLALTPGDPQVGTLHFDIGQSERVRADFVVGHIEDPLASIKQLNAQFSPVHCGRVHILKTALTPAGQSLAKAEDCPKTCWKDLSLHKPTLGRTSDDPTEVPLEVLRAFPTIIAEGLSSDAPVDVCTHTPVFEVEAGFEMGTMTIKAYVPPTSP